LFVYDMLVNVNVVYYVHVCEQARWARSAGNSAIENLCIIIITIIIIIWEKWPQMCSNLKAIQHKQGDISLNSDYYAWIQ